MDWQRRTNKKEWGEERMTKINYEVLENELKKLTSDKTTNLVINAIKNRGWTEEELKDATGILNRK